MSRLQDFMGKIISFWGGIQWGDKFIGTAVRDWVVDAYARFVVRVLEGIEDSYAGLLGPLLDKVEVPDKAKPQLQPIVDEIKTPTKQVAAMLGYSVGGTAVGGLISSTIGPYLLLLQYEMQRDADQYRLPLGSVLEARRRGWPLGIDWSTDSRDQGVTQERFDTLFEVSKLLIATGELQELLRRGEITSEEFTARMLMLGYDKGDIPHFETLKDIIPPLPDMTRFADFGAFDPTIIELWREFYDAPGWISEPFAKLGVTGEWANKYWFSHWRQPGRFELGELHRRFLIDDTLVKNAYLTQGYSSFWQDLLLKLAEEPLTRVDIRRMHKLGLLTDQELSNAYHAVGYYGDNNAKMVEFTKAYNSRTTTEADRDLTKSDILRMFADGLLSEPEVHAMLVDLDYGDEDAAYLIDLYREGAATKTRDLTLSQVRQLYERKLRTKNQITPFLEAFGFNADEIIALYELWDWEKPLELKESTRTLTLTQLRQLYERGLQPKSQLSAVLDAMGYNEGDIRSLYELWDWEKPLELKAKEAHLSLTQLRSLYKTKLRSKSQIMPFLVTMGYPSSEIAAIFELWEFETPPAVSIRERDLTVSQLKSLYQHGIRSVEDLRPVLAEMGYGDAEISALFSLWDITPPETERRPSRTDLDRFLTTGIINIDQWSEGYAALGYDIQYQEWYYAYMIETGKLI